MCIKTDVRSDEQKTVPYHPRSEPKYSEQISMAALKGIFAYCDDFENRDIAIGGSDSRHVTVCFIDGVVSGGDVSEDVIRPLTEARRLGVPMSPEKCMRTLLQGAVYRYSAKLRRTLDDLVRDITLGYCAVVFDDEHEAVTFEVRTSNTRNIDEPSVEKSVKGAKDAFVETLRVNTSLVRRRLRDPALKVRQTTVGRKSGTEVAVMYLDGVADPKTVGDMMSRLDAIDIDGLITAGNLEQYVTDMPQSPFPQMINTERPDRFSMNLLEGRVGVIADGLPLGFLVPASFSQFMKVSDDNTQHFITASALTILRYAAMIISVLLPAFYVAVAMYHQEMLPTKLLVSIISSKQNVPFSTAAEILGMLVSFELLQEAGIRLPSSIGTTLSIIGALIVGQSAVDAKVVSPIAIIVVALAGIGDFTQPSRDMGSALRIMRFIVLIVAMIFGMFGIMAALVALIWHLCAIDSFGVAYMSPVVDQSPGALKRAFLRTPLWKDKLRDPALNTPDKRNQK